MKLYLDDMRPVPVGWQGALNFDEAVELCKQFQFEEMSLDHDLGACLACMQHYTGLDTNDVRALVDAWLVKSEMTQMPNCTHFKTGYDFVCWLEENPKYWPKFKPCVHSANPVGRARMQQVVDKAYAID
jgi:hypothetical protein